MNDRRPGENNSRNQTPDGLRPDCGQIQLQRMDDNLMDKGSSETNYPYESGVLEDIENGADLGFSFTRRPSTQSDDSSLFGHLMAEVGATSADSFPPDLGDIDGDEDETGSGPFQGGHADSPFLASPPLHPCYQNRPYQGSSLMASTSSGLIVGQPSADGLLCTAKRGPGRPRKDGKIPVQRRPPFPGRPGRMRGRRAFGSISQLPAAGPSSLTLVSSIPVALPPPPLQLGANISVRPSTSFASKPTTVPEMKSSGAPPYLTATCAPGSSLPLTLRSNSPAASGAASVGSCSSHGDDKSINDAPYPGKVCAFCNLGYNSALGQGVLIRFEPSPESNLLQLSVKSKRSDSELSVALSDPFVSKPSGKTETKDKSVCSPKFGGKPMRRGVEDVTRQCLGPIDEMASVGFEEEMDFSTVFDGSGYFYVHESCAKWSEGVLESVGDSNGNKFNNVDKAVCMGITQRCATCCRFGATVRCKAQKCIRLYHFPCVVTNASFLDAKQLTALCSVHASQALSGPSRSEANCLNCGVPGSLSELLFCTGCGNHYHGPCLEPPISANGNVRAGWQCPECKVCQSCRQPGDDSKLLVCDVCDSGCHIFCMKPTMATVPKNGWKCKGCRVCGDCGARTPGNGPSSRWHMNYTVCDSCYQQRNKGSFCPICGKAYRQASYSEMLQCTLCRKLIHPECDPKFVQRKDGLVDSATTYVCRVCEAGGNNAITFNPLQSNIGCAELPREELIEQSMANFMSVSGDSFGSFNDDSLSSMDVDALEKQPPVTPEVKTEPKPTFSASAPGKPLPPTDVFQPPPPPPHPPGGKYPGKKRFQSGNRPRGTGGKFTGRKKAKTVEFRRKRGPKTKFKAYAPVVGGTATATGTSGTPIGLPTSSASTAAVSESEVCREKVKDEEPAVETKMILCSAKDEFILSQDLCVMCGSLGKEDEGRLISCSQCGQCYHPFCVNIKVTKVVLSKGWRCLDCTVCEGCGQPHDEARLLLCDECDISYHTYCLDPPLDDVPQGTWKCRWCVKCVKCSATTPGNGSLWQKNYTECGPCASQSICPVCSLDYQENDLIIQCIQCNRWLHSKCDNMHTEEECESAADFGYHCSLCRPKDEPPPHILQARKAQAMAAKAQAHSMNRELSVESGPRSVSSLNASRRASLENGSNNSNMVGAVAPEANTTRASTPVSTPTTLPTGAANPTTSLVSRAAGKFHSQYVVDGIVLSETGMSQIKSLIPEPPKRQRARRGAKQGVSPLRSEETEDGIKDEETGSLDDPKLVDENGVKQENVDSNEKKKRQRRLNKLGIGGFVVKQRGRMSKDEDPSEVLDALGNKAEASEAGVSGVSGKPKRKRKVQKKNQLQDNFPAYLQEAFFGKSLLDSSKDKNANSSFCGANVSSLELLSEDELLGSQKVTNDKIINLTPSEVLHTKTKSVKPEDFKATDDGSGAGPLDDEDLQYSEALRDLLPLQEDLPHDDELMNMLMIEGDDLDKNDEALDDMPVDDKVAVNAGKDDPIDSVLLSPHFNLETMVGDTGLPHMDGKDVEDIFKGVLSPSQGGNELGVEFQPLNSLRNIAISPGSHSLPKSPAMMSGAGPSSHLLTSPGIRPQLPVPSTSYAQQPPLTLPPVSVPNSGGMFPGQTGSSFATELPPISTASSLPASDFSSQWQIEPETEATSQGQKNILKWEGDEALGQMATISPVLYANMTYPNLKKDCPVWSDRVKQISKLWRQLPSDQRQPFLQKARENRAANRINKAQAEQNRVSGKDKSPVVRDTEQERQWKQLQAVRQQQQMQQQQVIEEQRSQALETVQLQPESEGDYFPSGQEPNQVTSERLVPAGYSQGHVTGESLLQPNAILSPSLTPELQTQLRSSPQGAMLPQPLRPPNTMSPAGVSPQMSPLIQVSRVRPPIDPLRIPISSGPVAQTPHDPYTHAPSTPRPSSGLCHGPSIRPGTPQRSPFSPSSPASSHPPQPLTPNEMFQTPPQTPRPSSCDIYGNQMQSLPPASPYMSQPRTPGPISSPFSPNQCASAQHQPINPSTPDPYSQPPCTPRPSSASSQQQPPPLSPINAFSPMSLNQEMRYSPAPRVTTSRSTESFPMNSPGAAEALSPYARPVTLGPHSDFVGQSSPVSSVPSDPYANAPMIPRPQPSGPQYSDNCDPYARPVLTPRPPPSGESYSRPTGGLRSPVLSQPDPYAYQPGTPRPAAHFTHRSSGGMLPPRPLPPAVSTAAPVDPYAQQPLTPMPAVHDPYAKPPLTPMPYSGQGSTDNSGADGGQGTTRHQLRDLLQKQQIRRHQVVDQIRPEGQWMDPNMRPRMAQQLPDSCASQVPRIPNMPHQIKGQVMSQVDGFRPPFPPMIRTRVMTSVGSDQVFRHPADGRLMVHRMNDPRLRAMQQQQMQMRNQQHWARMQNPGALPQRMHMQPMNAEGNHQYSGVGPRIPGAHPSGQIMMAQGPPQAQPQPQFLPVPHTNVPLSPTARPLLPPQLSPTAPRMPEMSCSSPAVPLKQVRSPAEGPLQQPPLAPQGVQPPKQPDQLVVPGTTVPKTEVKVEGADSEVKKPSTVELVQQVQEQTQPELVEEDTGPEDLDDDELLGLGNDFNILEYADPELDKALGGAGGSKNNIFDEHFDDLVEKEEGGEKAKADDNKPGKASPNEAGSSQEGTSKRQEKRNKSKADLPEQAKTQSTAEARVVTQPKVAQLPQTVAQHVVQECQASTAVSTTISTSSITTSVAAPALVASIAAPPAPLVPAPPPPPYPGANVQSHVQPHVQETRLPQPPPPPYEPPHEYRQPIVSQQVVNIPHESQPIRGPCPRPMFAPRPEQALLLEDLVDQEKKDQKRLVMESRGESEHFMGGQGDALLSDLEFERLKADILSDDSLSGPPGPLVQPSPMQSPTGPPPIQTFAQHQQQWHDPHVDQYSQPMIPSLRLPRHAVMNQMQPRMGPGSASMGMPSVRMPLPQQQGHPAMVGPALPGLNQQNIGQGHAIRPVAFKFQTIAPPPTPPVEAMNDHDLQMQAQYENWITAQQNLLSTQQKCLENEVTKLRKTKKTLNAKQRQLRKNNSELPDVDASELARVSQEQAVIQKQLEHVRKQARQHQNLVTEHTVRRQQKRPPMVGAPQTVPVPVHSPGLMASQMVNQPRGSLSPMIMGSGPGTPGSLSMGAPGTPLAAPGTPQSPAMMSPSPMAPSPSPMMHSPVTSLQHSPANVPPASPMMQSPIYQQQPSPMNMHTPGNSCEGVMRSQGPSQGLMQGQEDHNLMSEMYQQRPIPSGSQLRGQMQGNYQSMQQNHFDNQNVTHSQPQSFQPRMAVGHVSHGQVSHQSIPYQAKPGDGIRYITQQSPRPYGEMVGQPFPAQMSSGHQMYQQQHPPQQQLVRRMAPPPYPGQFQQQHPQQQQSQVHHQQHQQQLQQQQHHQQQQQQHYRMYGMPQVAVSQQMIACPPPRQMSSDVTRMDQTIRMPVTSCQTSVYQRNVSPDKQDARQEFTYGSEMSILTGSDGSNSSQTAAPFHGEFNKSEPECFKEEQDVVGEAKTSMTLHFEEKGSGEDNEAVNDIVSELSCDTPKNQSQEVDVSVNSEFMRRVKEEPNELTASCSGVSAECDEQTTVKIEVNNQSSSSNCQMTQETEGDAQAKEETVFGQNEDLLLGGEGVEFMELSVGDPGYTKQNVLLKQLLQNCPSADSLAKSQAKLEKVAAEKLQKEAAKAAQEAKSAASIASKDTSSQETSTPATPVTPVSDNTAIEMNIEGNQSSNSSMTTSTEKKLTYLDIRRAQLEREPTPPPEEAKPKRKRITKRKESKGEGAGGAGVSGGATKKRARKGSQSRPDEDYELYLSTLMTQLRSLQPMPVLEPIIRPNFNACPVYGCGDLNAGTSSLRGIYGQASLAQADQGQGQQNQGPEKTSHGTPAMNFSTGARLGTSSQGISRGFYSQEFSKSLLGSPSFLLSPSHGPNGEYSCYLRDTESPESIVSSSSPECVLYDEPQLAFNRIRLIHESDDEEDLKEGKKKRRATATNLRSSSPVIPLLVPIPLRPGAESKLELHPEHANANEFDAEKDKDKENLECDGAQNGLARKVGAVGATGVQPLRDSSNVAVTLTLSSDGDIKRILSALAKILEISPPSEYEIVERTVTPPSQKLGLYNNKDDQIDNPDYNVDHILNGKMKFCRFCEIVIMNGGIIKKVSELPPAAQEEAEEEVTFCSSNCYMQFALSHNISSGSEEKEAGPVVSHLGSDDLKNKDTFVRTTKESEPISLKPPPDLLPPMSPMMEEDDISEKNSATPAPGSPKSVVNSDVEKGSLSRKHSWLEEDATASLPNSITGNSEASPSAAKKWHGVKYKTWSANTFEAEPAKYDNDEKEVGQLLDNLNICIKPDDLPGDERKCQMCHEVGDLEADGPGRLLNMDVDKWIHLNCALWSSEVYETVNGALINVDVACKRAVSLSCIRCHTVGASLKCFKVRCANYYHFACAFREKCMFFKDKTLFCPQHIPKMPNPEAAMTCFAVPRRVYVNRDEHRQMASMIHLGEQNLMRIGNMIFLSIGQLLPHQLQNFHTPTAIYPVGYKIVRFYWSMRLFGKRCRYVCAISDNNGHPEFSVEVQENGYQPLTLRERTPRDVWQKIMPSIVKMRQENGAIKVFADYVTGEDLFGLSESSVVRILESLPGVDTLSDYNFRFGRSQFLELPLAINPSGCARAEPKLRTHFNKRPHTLHTSNASRSSLQSSFGGICEIQSPYIKQFVHSKSSQYRKMKTEWRNNVFLARSGIQGLGLYAARDIEKHTMVIEYIGQLIRNEIAERNERLYETQNRPGVYMFRLDENRVVDATLSGGLARYANHSCSPNCVAEVVQIDRENKILIIANRRISRGEEITYDYRFDEEDETHKISCLCGAPNCRKWMN